MTDEIFKKTQEEIELMNKPFTMGSDENDDLKTEPPTTEEPNIKTEPPTTEEPSIKTDAPETDAPKTDAPTTDAPDDRDQIISDLRAKLNEKDVTIKAPTTNAPIIFEDQDFLKDLDLDDVTKDPKEFNKILNSVYQRGMTDTQKTLGNQVTQSIPNMITIVSNLQKATEDFYGKNKDLKPFKKVVATVFDDLVTSNPDKPYADIMIDVAQETRKRLELPKPSNKEVDKGTPPRLPNKKKKPGQAEHKPNLSSVESDIDEMNKIIRR